MLTAGTYVAKKIVSAFIGESPEKKTPYFSVEFEVDNGQGGVEYLEWVAWLSQAGDKAIAATNRHLKTLVDLGFKGDKLSDLADEKKGIEDLFGPASDEIKLVVEVVNYGENNQHEKNEVKFVNVGNQSNLTKFDHKTAVTKFKSLPFDGTLKKLRSGEKVVTKAEKKDPPADTGAKQGTLPNGDATGEDDTPPF